MLGNADPGSFFAHVDFNRHSNSHLARAAQEGIVFAFHYGMEILKQTGIEPSVIRAGHANMFLSPVFCDTLAGVTGATIELYDTDGSQGAAKGAGVGAGVYSSFTEAFYGLKKIETVEPDLSKANIYLDAYGKWLEVIQMIMKTKK